MPKFREISGQFVGYVPDGTDPDINPDREPMNGRVTFTPVFTGGVIAFPELVPPEFAHPEPISARIIDGFVQVQVGTDDDVSMQPLSLMVTVDDEASQVWSWRAEFTNMRIGDGEVEVTIPAWSFRVPDGTGPVDLTELVPLKSGGSVDVTKGPRGAGLQNITAVDGQLVFEYTDGEETTVPIPEAVQGPQGEPGPAGADGAQGPEGPQGPAGEIPDLLVGNITDATPTGKNLMLAATEGAARNALGLQTGATTIAGAYSELENGTQTNSRVWSPKNLSDYVEERVDAAKVIVNVKDYGAIGDGTNEDHIPIQSAIDALALRGGGTIIIPPGTYYFRQLVNLESNVHILGYGATILKQYATDSPYTAFRGRSGATPGHGSGVNNVTVEGLTFRGNYDVDRSICAFALHRARNITIRNCNFIEAAGSGHVMDLNGCDGVTIRDCVFMGHNLRPNNNVTSECIQLDQSKRGSVSSIASGDVCDGTMSRRITIDSCKFLPYTKNDETYPAPNPIGNHTTREGAWYEDVRFTNNLIVDPVVDTSSSTSRQQYRGNLHFVGQVKGIVIEGNKWVCTTSSAVRVISLYGTTRGNPASQDPDVEQDTTTIPNAYPRDVRIANNTFDGFTMTSSENNTIRTHSVGDSSGVFADIRVAGNTFTGRTGAYEEIRVVDCVRAQVADNFFSGVNSRFSPISVDGRADRVLVSGNIAMGYQNATSGTITGSGTKTVVNNVL